MQGAHVSQWHKKVPWELTRASYAVENEAQGFELGASPSTDTEAVGNRIPRGEWIIVATPGEILKDVFHESSTHGNTLSNPAPLNVALSVTRTRKRSPGRSQGGEVGCAVRWARGEEPPIVRAMPQRRQHPGSAAK